MHPLVELTPASLDEMDFTADMLVFDVIYNPSPTRFLRDAAARGARTVGGIEMFLHQAAAQFQAVAAQLPGKAVAAFQDRVPRVHGRRGIAIADTRVRV